MLRVYEARSVNEYYPVVCADLMTEGMISRPRGLETRELHPTVAHISDPRQRVVTSHGRVANLPFALAEVVQIISGRNDAQALKYYNTKIIEVAGDEPNCDRFNAHYGERMRKFHVGTNRSSYGPRIDQLQHVISTLAYDGDSRQASIVLSHPGDDNYTVDTKDRACNVYAHAMIREGKLDWMQVMRSNDIIWGLPYNFMQWMHVMEWVASSLDVPLGQYTLMQDSLHVYQDKYEECQNVQQFDMYSYIDKPLTMMVPRNDEWFLSEVMRYEEIMRNEGPKPILTDEEDEYWLQVVQVFNSFAAFKRLKNEVAFELMPDHPELRWPLMRYYFNVRWRRPGYRDCMDRVCRELTRAFGEENALRWLGYD